MSNQKIINNLLRIRNGEAKNALYHPKIGHIDLVWGKSGPNGYGLAHIEEKHPKVISNLYEIVKESVFIDCLEDRIILLYQKKIKSIISLTWIDEKKRWLVTSYEILPP